jgi:outer membrane protein TolC
MKKSLFGQRNLSKSKKSAALLLWLAVSLWLLLVAGNMPSALAEQYAVGSYPDALKLGLARNLRLHESEKRVEEARNALLRVRAVFLPKAHLSAGFNQKGAAFTIPAFVLQGIPKDPGFFTGYKSEWTTRLQVDQPLFTGGRSLYSYQIARHDLEIQEETHRLRRAPGAARGSD